MMTTTLRRWSRLVVLALALPLATACEITPEPLHVGAEECAHCSMLISDRRYAAQLLTTKGKAYKFDAIECMHAFVRSGAVATEDTHSLWVMDIGGSDGWLAAQDAFFVHSAELRTPMGGGLAAHATAGAARETAHQLNGTVLNWADLVAMELPADAHRQTADHSAHHGHGD
jgi:copper chaperone NosL